MKKLKKFVSCSFAVIALLAFSCPGGGMIGNLSGGRFAGVSAAAYTDVEKLDCALSGAPAVITEITSAEELSGTLSAETKAGSAIIRIDENLNVVDEQGGKIGALDETLNGLSDVGILPVIRLETGTESAAFVRYAGENALKDYTIVGADTNLLLSAKSSLPEARVCVDFSGGVSYSDPYYYLEACQETGAHIALCSQSQMDFDYVFWLQARLITVWIKSETNSEVEIADLIAKGGYGIVSSEPEKCCEVYDKYTSGTIPRGYYNIAHRGLPSLANENSMEGYIAAYEAGATHLEIDVRLTADGKLAVMHDASINRTTDGDGIVEEMTSKELSLYHIIRNIGGQKTGVLSAIPFLDDIFEYFKDKEIVLVIEIKSESADFCRAFKNYIKEFDIARNVIVISFHEEQLKRLYTLMPEIPVATLNSVEASGLDRYLTMAATYNMRFDPPYSSLESDFWDGNMKNRGYMSWGWTYDGYSGWRAAGAGVTGITNNNADAFKNGARKVLTDSISLAAGEDIEKKSFSLRILMYSGEEKTVEANLFLSEKTEDGYRVILCYKDKAYWRYTGSIALLQEKENVSDNTSENDPGCGSAAVASAVFPVVAVMVSFFLKKRR